MAGASSVINQITGRPPAIFISKENLLLYEFENLTDKDIQQLVTAAQRFSVQELLQQLLERYDSEQPPEPQIDLPTVFKIIEELAKYVSLSKEDFLKKVKELAKKYPEFGSIWERIFEELWWK